MKTDRELLELAAKAAGYEVNKKHQAKRDELVSPETASLWIDSECTAWNSIRDGGHSLRLAVKLGMLIIIDREQEVSTVKWCASEQVREYWNWNGNQGADAATRRAITRAAAAIGEHMP